MLAVLAALILAVMLSGAAPVAAATTTPLQANLSAPAIAYSFSGRLDGSFNEAAARGARRFTEMTGVKVTEISPVARTEPGPGFVEEVLLKAVQGGADPVIAVGFHYADAVRKVAAAFPDRRFTIIDTVVEAPNVQSVVFKAEEGSYLVGMMAALASKNRRVGFVGAMDVPVIRQFLCGYAEGVRRIDGFAVLEHAFIGTTGDAFRNPQRAKDLALGQIDRGADVVFHAAGASGLGVIDAAHQRGVKAIGVDSNQNGVRPGTVLTSMLKRLDIAVYLTLTAVLDGTWTPGVTRLGLAEEGVGWAYDEHNALLVTSEMTTKVADATFRIVGGEVKPQDGADGLGCLAAPAGAK